MSYKSGVRFSPNFSLILSFGALSNHPMQNLLAAPTALLLLVSRLPNPRGVDAHFTINPLQPSDDVVALKRVIYANIFKLSDTGLLRPPNSYFLFRHCHQVHTPLAGVRNPTLSIATGPWWKDLSPNIKKVWKSLQKNLTDLHHLYFLHIQPELTVELADNLLTLFGEITLENMDNVPLPVICGDLAYFSRPSKKSLSKKKPKASAVKGKRLSSNTDSLEDEKVRTGI